jgi:hypothetical protein
VPRVRPLDDPTPRLSSNAPDERSLAPPTDVRRDAARSDGGLDIRVVVAFVEAQMLGTSWAPRTAEHNRVERIGDEPLVVDVRSGDLSRHRHATTLCEHVALDAPLRAIGRVGTGQIPPLGAFTMELSSEDHFHWIPRRRS